MFLSMVQAMANIGNKDIANPRFKKENHEMKP